MNVIDHHDGVESWKSTIEGRQAWQLAKIRANQKQLLQATADKLVLKYRRLGR
jgi:hypothetical protein